MFYKVCQVIVNRCFDVTFSWILQMVARWMSAIFDCILLLHLLLVMTEYGTSIRY